MREKWSHEAVKIQKLIRMHYDDNIVRSLQEFIFITLTHLFGKFTLNSKEDNQLVSDDIFK